jgi:hypothetical protein
MLFNHHQGSPFTPIDRQAQHDVVAPTIADNNFSQSKVHQHPFINSSKNTCKFTPPRRTPIKFITQNNTSSRPYDPSTNGSHMTKSPLVQSIDSAANHTKELERSEVKHFNSMSPFELTSPIMSFSMQSQKQLLPSGVKLAPKISPRKRSLAEKVDEAQSSLKDMDSFPSRIKLTPRSTRLEMSSPILSLPAPMMADTDGLMILQFNAIGSKGAAHVQGMKHFPCIPKFTPTKSRSLLYPKGLHDPIQSLLRADAVVEAARANEPLTDDEGSDVESDPDYVLCCPSSVANDSISTENLSFRRRILSGSTPSLFGTSEKNAHEQQVVEVKASYGKSICIDTDLFKRTESICSLTLSNDSEQLFACRSDLFTPPPILGNDERSCALSPPAISPKRAKVS